MRKGWNDNKKTLENDETLRLLTMRCKSVCVMVTAACPKDSIQDVALADTVVG